MPAVKTAISIEKTLYDGMQRFSKRLGVPRSRLFAQAVEEFLRRRQSELHTEQLNRVYSRKENSRDRRVRRAAMVNFHRLLEGTW